MSRMSSALHVKLFNQFKEITDAARSAVSRYIVPLLEGSRVSNEHDAKLVELYEEWQAACRASAGALKQAPYPNELMPMPKMPVDDDEHQACRQMAAVLIERAVYDEFTAQRWFHAVAENIKKNPNCANHSKSCPCQEGLKGWTYAENVETVKQLKTFYDSHYDDEKDEDYVAAICSIASKRGITFEEEMAGWRRQRQHNKALLAKDAAKEAAREAAKAKMREECVFICYQDFDELKYAKHNRGKCMHGWFRVVKTEKDHEFTIVDTGGMQHPSWHTAVANKEVWRFPLDVAMGVKGDTFECVTPDKIHQS